MNFFLRSVRIAPYGANGSERVKLNLFTAIHEDVGVLNCTLYSKGLLYFVDRTQGNIL